MIERWRGMRDQDAVVTGLTFGVTHNGAPLVPAGDAATP